MDIWEANSFSTACTAHPCTKSGPYRCTGAECDSGICDSAGCDFNPFRQGDKTLYGKGRTVDTSSKFTVVTQFITDTGTATGTLSEIRRLYIQNGKVIQNSKTNIPGMSGFDSITDNYCTAQKTAFQDIDAFRPKGGLAAMGKSLSNGVILVMSIRDDHVSNMLWLDSNYPTNKPATQPGVARGTCPTTSGTPTDVENSASNASVIFSNIKFGDISITYGPTPPGTTPGNPGTPTTTTSAPAPTQTTYGQW